MDVDVDVDVKPDIGDLCEQQLVECNEELDTNIEFSDEIDIKEENIDIQDQDQVVLKVENEVDDVPYEAPTKWKLLKEKKIPKEILKSGRILILRYRREKHIKITSLATMCTCARCGAPVVCSPLHFTPAAAEIHSLERETFRFKCKEE